MEPIRLPKSKYLKSDMQIYYKPIADTVMHWHEFYEVTLILSGKGGQHINGQWHPLAKGTIFLMAPTDFHDIVSDPDDTLELLNIIFSEEMLDKEIYPLLYEVHGIPQQLNDADFTEIKKLYDLIADESSEVKIGQRRMMMAALERILILLTRHFIQNTPRIEVQSLQNPIRKSLVYLQNHFREPVSLSEIAHQVQMSPNYFSERFSREVGVPFQQYLQNLRLDFAKNLIKSSNLPITEICMISGFNALPHFQSTIKRRFQTTPRNFRKS